MERKTKSLVDEIRRVAGRIGDSYQERLVKRAAADEDPVWNEELRRGFRNAILGKACRA